MIERLRVYKRLFVVFKNQRFLEKNLVWYLSILIYIIHIIDALRFVKTMKKMHKHF